MRGERSGQITMFVLLGLVILMVVGVLYIVATAQRDADNLQDRIEGTIALSDMALIDRHVGSCLDTIVTDELRIIGETGALVNNGDSAIIGAGNTARRVAYGVARNADTEDTGVRPAAFCCDRYPDSGVGIENSTIDPLTGAPFPAHSGGYFGDVMFVAICDREGPNNPFASVRCQSYPGTPPGTAGPSVQETLERNIAQRVAVCASSRVFEDAIGRAVTQVGDAMVNVTYLPASLTVALQYPLELDDEVVLQTAPIARSYDVRLLSILQFAADLALEESRNITFTPEHDYQKISSWKDGFSVGRTRDVPISPVITSPTSDLIVIRDTQSSLNNIAYTFQFLIEHRIPMLNSFLNEDAARIFIDMEEPVGVAIAADADDGIIPFDSPRISRISPSSQGVMEVIVWDTDCQTPYSKATCRDYDFFFIY